MLTELKQRLRYAQRLLSGQETFIRPDQQCQYELLGNEGASFAVIPELVPSGCVVYSFGIGKDISFDQELIRRFGASVYAFDPTPASCSWLAGQQLPNGFRAFPYGISDRDGEVDFLPPQKEANVSYSSVSAHHVNATAKVSLPVRCLSSILKELQHERIGLLKLDIEGMEYSVLEDLLNRGFRVPQLCVEFHHRWPEIGPSRTKEMVNKLRASGYRLFYVSRTGEEFSFVDASQLRGVRSISNGIKEIG